MSWSSNLFIKIIGIWIMILVVVRSCDADSANAEEVKKCYRNSYTMEQVIASADGLMEKYGRYWSKVVSSSDGKVATMFFIWEKYSTAAVHTFVDGCLYAIDERQSKEAMALLIAQKPLALLFPAEGIEN